MWGEFGTPVAARRVRVREAFGVGHRRRLDRRPPTMVQPTPGGMVRLWKRLGSASWHGYAMRSSGTRSSTLSSARPARSCRCTRTRRRTSTVHREDSRERYSAHRGARGRVPDRRRRSHRLPRRAGHDSVAERAGAPIISETRSRYSPAPAGGVRPQLSDRQIALASSDVGDDHGVPILERGPIPPSAATGRRRPGVRAGRNHVLRGRAACSRADIIESKRASNRPKHRESPRRLRDYAVYLEHEPHPQMRPPPPRRSSHRAPAATDSG